MAFRSSHLSGFSIHQFFLQKSPYLICDLCLETPYHHLPHESHVIRSSPSGEQKMPSRSFPHRDISATFPSFALLSSPFDLVNYHIISLKPSSRDHSTITIEIYPLPEEHRILSSSPNSTSVSPPPSHPPTLNSKPKQNYPSTRRYPDHHYLKSSQQNNSIHHHASHVLQFCL